MNVLGIEFMPREDRWTAQEFVLWREHDKWTATTKSLRGVGESPEDALLDLHRELCEEANRWLRLANKIQELT